MTVQSKVKDQEIVLAYNKASWSWNDNSKQQKLYVVLDKNTGNLNLIETSYSSYGINGSNQNSKRIRGRWGTIDNPNLKGINSLFKEYNQGAQTKMKRDTWTSELLGIYDQKLIDILRHPDLKKQLAMSLFDNETNIYI